MANHNIDPMTIAKLGLWFKMHDELREALGAITIETSYLGPRTVHLPLNNFLQTFKDFEIEEFAERRFIDIPHKFVAIVNGITFFAVGDASKVSMRLIMKEAIEEARKQGVAKGICSPAKIPPRLSGYVYMMR